MEKILKKTKWWQRWGTRWSSVSFEMNPVVSARQQDRHRWPTAVPQGNCSSDDEFILEFYRIPGTGMVGEKREHHTEAMIWKWQEVWQWVILWFAIGFITEECIKSSQDFFQYGCVRFRHLCPLPLNTIFLPTVISICRAYILKLRALWGRRRWKRRSIPPLSNRSNRDSTKLFLQDIQYTSIE